MKKSRKGLIVFEKIFFSKINFMKLNFYYEKF